LRRNEEKKPKTKKNLELLVRIESLGAIGEISMFALPSL
jgi:hypothetical protein